MNIYDLPIPNFGELENEAALKLILEVRMRRRAYINQRPVAAKSTSERGGTKSKTKKTLATSMGKLSREQVQELLAALKSNG